MTNPEDFPYLLLIGQFSKLSGLSCRMLRFYAEQNILVPAFTDNETGYRRYLASQLMEARLLRRLRQADFSIGDIAAILNGIKTDERQQRAVAHREAIRQKIKALEIALEELELIAGNWETEECVLTRIAPMYVRTAPLTGERLHLRDIARARAEKLYGDFDDENIAGGPILCTYNLQSGPSRATVCIPTERKTDEILPGGIMATTLHKGSYENLTNTLGKLLKWVENHGYRPEGRVREWYFPNGEEEAPYSRVELSLSLEGAPFFKVDSSSSNFHKLQR